MKLDKLNTVIPPLFLQHVVSGCTKRGFGIIQTAHFISQTMHESAGYTRLQENLNYSASGLRKTWPTRFTAALAAQLARNPEAIANHVYGRRLGNSQPGDGWLFRGRGIIQVTGRSNYRNCSEAVYNDMRLLTDPDLLLTAKDSVISAFWYWDKNRIKDLLTVKDVTKKINGGTNGLADRQKRFDQIIKIIT